MTDYTIRYKGNCPIVDRSSHSTFDVSPAITITNDICERDIEVKAGITNTFNGQPTELLIPGSDAYPQSLDSFEERAIDAVKRMFVSGACDIKKGDTFHFEGEGNAHDKQPPMGHDFHADFYAALSAPTKTLIVTVASDTTLAINNPDGTTELFDKEQFLDAVKAYSAERPAVADYIAEEDDSFDTAGIQQRSAEVIPLFG